MIVRLAKAVGGLVRWPVCVIVPSGPRLNYRWWVPAEGRCWLAFAVLLLLLALSKGINLLLLLSYLLLVILVANAVLVPGRRMRRLTLTRYVEGPVFAQTPCPVVLRARNPHRWAVSGLSLEDCGPAHRLEWFAPRLPPRSDSTFRANLVVPNRGRYEGSALFAASDYPFGLVRRRVYVGRTPDVLVLPRLGWLHRGRLRQLLRTASPEEDAVRRHRPQRHPSARAEFHGLRPWRTGDSSRQIHWPTSARCGEWMVREYEDEPSDNLIVIFDPTLQGPNPEAFEAAVSLAATICWEWCRQAGERLVAVIADGQPAALDGLAGPAHAQAVLERLAVVQNGPDCDLRALQRCLRGVADVAAGAIVVAAGPSSLTEPCAAALTRPVTCLMPDAGALDYYRPPDASMLKPMASV